MGSRRRKVGIAVAFHVGGIDGVRKYLRRKYRFAFPSYWIGAARTHPIRAFALASWVVWWKELGNGITAFWFTIPTVIIGVSAWYWYRYKKTGLSMKEAARQLRLQKRVEERWVKACKAGGISVNGGATGVTIPPLKKITFDKGDVAARVYTGQYAIPSTEVVKNRVRIAETVGCREVTIRHVASGVMDVRFCFSDPLARTIKPADIKTAKARTCPIGIDVGGATLALPVLDDDGCCVFVPTFFGGVSRSGKSTGLWGTLAGLRAMEIPVRVRVVDPKGGAELWALGDAFRRGIGTPLFKVHSYTKDPDEAEQMVTDHHQDMKKRLDRMAGKRKHKPTTDEPLDLLIIDEFLAMPNLYMKPGKKAIQTEIVQTMIQGAAAGYSIVACAQLGEKAELGPVREFFINRICARTKTREQTITILGSGGSADDAPAHEISPATPGVVYMYDESTASSVKGRLMYVTDNMTAVIAAGEVLPGLEHLGSAPAVEDVPRAVYWHYGYPDSETGGRVLWYVGSASNPTDRFKQHAKDRKSRRWWNKTDHSARRIEWYPTQAEGYAAEWAAIDRDQPLYNDKGNRDNPARLTDEPAADEVAA